ncbi:M23 family metallopeptidase [Sorangium sp. So ce136]|uniref:M23 family metallopeptidase n=1 Tax=Sorangium sp. So ce136 TaxID=3133284 RepID=UPI003F070BD6
MKKHNIIWIHAAVALWGSCSSMGDARAAEGADVSWNNLVEVAASDGGIARGPGSGWHAGASSVERIEAGDGFVEFSTSEADLYKAAGLSHGDDNQGYADIDHAIFLRGDGGLEIVEQGYGQGFFGIYEAGDVFRVEVFNGQVRYRKNGIVFHTSTTPPTYPLLLDTSLYDEGATVTSAQLTSCAAGDTSCMPPGMWKNVRYATANGGVLTRGPGSGWSAGASSAEQIEAGDGFVEFSTNEAILYKMAGLSHGDDNQGYSDMDYAIFLRGDGGLEIVEQGYGQGYFGTYEAGDVFRVEVLDGQVRYLKNGLVFHTSATAPTYPLALDTSLYDEGATLTSARVVRCAAEGASCTPPGTWKNVRYTTANGGVLTRGPGSGWSAGASSAEQIEAGDGFVEFSTNEAILYKMAGLSHGDDDQGYSDTDYAIFLRGDGGLEIVEQGYGQGYFGTYEAGDVFRVEVLDGQVRYLKNGLVFHTSTTAPTYPLALDTSLYDAGATLTSARVVRCAAGDASCVPPPPWKNVRYATANGGLLTRGPGSGWSAGASSAEQVEAGDGFVEFSTNETDRYKMAGLSHGDDNQGNTDIDHAIFLRGDGGLEIVEQGYGQGYFGTYEAGDVFRVEVFNGQVRYRKNGLVFHTSTTAPTYPLVLDTSLYDAGATLTSARVVRCAAGDASCMPPGQWKNVRYATANGGLLTRTAGSGWSAGASSVARIAGGDGFVEFSTNETDRYKIAGLSHGDDSQDFWDIDYGIYLGGDSRVEIVEHRYGQGYFGTYEAGDVFRVEVLDGQVRYLKNGLVFHTSATVPTYPLVLDTSLYDAGATITNAKVVGAGGPTMGCGDLGPGDELSDVKVPTFCNFPTTMPNGDAPPMGQYFGNTCTSVEIQYDYYKYSSGDHSGLDFAVPARSPLYSVGYGKVMCAGRNACTNRFPIARGAPAQIDLTIRYGAVYVIYGHAASSLVAEGDLVVPGQEIGESSDWPGNDHLHFEVRRIADNKSPNPVPLFSPDLRSYLEGTVSDADFCTGHFDDQPDVLFTNYPQIDQRPCTDANDGATGPIRCQERCTEFSAETCEADAGDVHEHCRVFDCGGGAVACGLRWNTAAQACP